MLLTALSFALLLQQPASASRYSSDAVRELVAAAADANVRVPPGLASYTATVETEAALVSVDPRGREQSMQIEQVAQSLAWNRRGEVHQRVLGYRTEASVFTGMTVLTVPTWVVPVLYGNRFSLFFGPRPDTPRRDGSGAARRDTIPTARRVVTVHPLAADRDGIYRFTGGDTVAIVRPGGRSIPVVRVRVEPSQTPAVRTTALRGEILIEAATHQLIAMRGELIEIGGSRSLLARAGSQLVQAFAYIDFESREVEGRYWLPSRQRIEFQVGSVLAGDARAVWRFQSRYDDVEIVRTDTLAPADPADTIAALPRRRSLAPDAELSSYDRWRWSMAEGTTGLRADDFDDVAGGARQVTGARGAEPVRITTGIYARNFDEVLRFNRVEGLFTGIGARARVSRGPRSIAIGGSVGRAWHEGAVRGGAFAQLDAGDWLMTAGAERRLEIANPFGDIRTAGTSGTFAALLGNDDFDYLDRRQLSLRLERDLAGRDGRLETLAAIASDDGMEASVSRGLFRVDSAFRANRPVDDGSYAKVGLSAVLHPDVAAEWTRPGWTAGVRVEQAAGELSWLRVEGMAGSRTTTGRITTTVRVDAGLVESGRVPLQQLFSVGGFTDVPGFEYKEFGGDRAVLTRASVRYALPVLEAPMRAPFGGRARGRIPPLAPMLAVGLRGVWTEASSTTTLETMRRLGMRSGADLLTRPTRGMPAAASAGVLLFGGGLFVGVSRRLDTAAPWTLTFAPSTAL